ncbi:hypothetical protein ACJ73_05219 [Blastomyces percursus]|uniref:Uncharacterized protein n=1 Tax=Blastomyces percursus TaxID=1658174 RepID=A0A1J9Q5P9_9EURO|nr:hypothetical protein ACJ73_05219 [Blastomyces percursus]
MSRSDTLWDDLHIYSELGPHETGPPDDTLPSEDINNVDFAPPIEAQEVIQPEQAPPNTTPAPYYLIRHSCSLTGTAPSFTAEWLRFGKGGTMAGSTMPQVFKYEGDKVIPATTGTSLTSQELDLLAKSLKSSDLGLLMIPFCTTETQPELRILLVAVHSREKVQLSSGYTEFLRNTMALAPVFLEMMVQDGLSERGPWKSDIRKLARRIEGGMGMSYYFTKLYAPRICPMNTTASAVIEGFLRDTLNSVDTADWKHVAHVYGRACEALRITKEVSEEVETSLRQMNLDEKRRVAYL